MRKNEQASLKNFESWGGHIELRTRNVHRRLKVNLSFCSGGGGVGLDDPERL